MAKKSTNYFSHDSNARNDEKLLRLRMRHGAAGYGVYFMLIERLREESNYTSAKDYNMIAFDLRVDAAIIKSVVEDFGLFAFTDDGKCFYSESLLNRMQVKDIATKKLSEAGKLGMEKRWDKNAAYQSRTPSKGNTPPASQDVPAPKAASTASTAAKQPPSGAEHLTLEIQSLMQDTQWTEIIMLRYSITVEVLRKWLEEFRQKCLCDGKDRHENLAEAKRHFSNWLRIQQQEAAVGRTNRKNHTPSPAVAIADAEAAERREQERKQREQQYKQRSERAVTREEYLQGLKTGKYKPYKPDVS